MGGSRITSDQDLLRRFDGDTAEVDARVLGACEAVATALVALQVGADGIDVPAAGALEVVHEHHDRARALAELFDLAAERFDESQQRALLPWVFGWRGADWTSWPRGRRTGWRAFSRPAGRASAAMGPPSQGAYNTARNRRWLDDRLRGISQAPRSRITDQVARDLRRSIGLSLAPRLLVRTHVVEWSAGAGVGVGAEIGGAWIIQIFSDGSADVTLRIDQSSNGQAGIAAGAVVGCGDLSAGIGGSVGVTVTAGGSRSFTRSFRSAQAAEAFVDHHRLAAFVDRGLRLAPGVGPLLAAWVDATGMEDAPVQERTWSADLSLEASTILLTPDVELGAGGSARGQITYGRLRDDRTGLTAESALVEGAIGLALTAFGHDWTPALARAQGVSVERDAAGRPVALTVTTKWDGEPGRPPPVVPPAAAPAGSAAKGTDGPHLYADTVVVDLTDARNAELAERVGAYGSPTELTAIEVLEIASLVDDDVRARSWVAIREEATESAEVCEAGAELAVGGKVSIEGEMSETTSQAVALWSGPGDRLTPVALG